MEVITTHTETDFDGLASMVAAQNLYPGSVLVIPRSCQPSVRSFLSTHSLPHTPEGALQFNEISRLVLVDTQDPARIGSLKKLLENQKVSVHIFDHHPTDSPKIQADFCLVNPVGATITLLVEYLQERGTKITPFHATLYSIGLYEETGSLLYPDTTHRDMQVAAFLLQHGADLNVVANYIRREMTVPQIELLNAMIQASHALYLGRCRVLLIILSWPTYIPNLAGLVEQLSKLERVDAVLAAVAMEGKVQLIGRSRRKNIDMNRIAQSLGGGGHPLAAAASIKGLTLMEVENRLRELLHEQAKSWLPIKEMMTAPVRTVPEGTRVSDTECLMTKYEVNALPVQNAKGGFVGLVTRETIQKALYHRLHSTCVEQVMRQDIYTASPNTSFEEVQIHMIERNQRVVPILQRQKVVGIFSRTDLLRAFHEDEPGLTRNSVILTRGTKAQPDRRHRNLKNLMRDRLPKGIQKLLRTGGVLADRLEMSAYVVGGFVRDLLLGIPNFDVDMVVEGDGIQFGKALAADLQTRAKTHERFGTASLKIPSQSDFPAECSLDIATARTEYYEYPTALPNVERSSIKKDLYRRDFTLNTLAVRLNKRPGELLDFFGGQRDIKDKTIRVLHSLSFIEDPTRVFRAIRFEQRFGFKISKETTAFIHSAVTMELFHRLSGHRLGDELIHLLSEPFPGKGLQRLKEFDLLKFIHPDLEWNVATSRLFQNIAEVLTWHRLEFPDEQVQEWVLYAMAFFESVEKASVQNTWTRLGFAEGSKRMAVAFFKEQNRLSRSLAQTHLLPDQVYSLLKPWPVEPLLFLMAKTHPPSPPALTMQRVRQYLSTFRFVKSSVTGRDLQKYGLRKGPAYALVLNQILSACLNGEVHSREEELALAQSLVAKKQRSLRKSQTC